MRRTRAFTLAELLTVVSILGLLLLLLFPSLRSAQRIARTTICANNLKRIGEGAHAWGARHDTVDLHLLIAGGWPSGVAQQLGGGGCLICPEGGLAVAEPEEPDLGEIASSGVVEEMIQIVYNGNRGVPFVVGPKMLKLSNTQRAGHVAEGRRYDPVEYAPDENPNVYWWEYEDGGDYDYQDMAVQVTINGDGTATLFCQSWTAGHPELGDMDFNILARHEEINAHYFGANASKTLSLDVGAVTGDTTSATVAGGGASSYGMNASDLDLHKLGKMLALDYLCVNARGTDDWSNPEWDEDGDRVPDFIRHGGRLNVLFVDGRVETMFRPQIDPVVADVQRHYWEPSEP